MNTFFKSLGGNLDELQSKTIDWLRFPLILLVIYIHAFGEELSDGADLGVSI